ncbi:asparaginase [Evansella cellulosilytica]|uniref:asparaginase n=1 Tax=Evansella cellulosilytica (strain ATCC 21833 / DSM 2522 / FERM P-1141 / JCM 9156 / N-4) TaxID=649639 RepID=E6TYQ5_EVAC2|nr:asparaginase [Evansella cellulosilytica]ADU30105.1 Asparaginase/glutaminase [Evansella cellulosilytica DSM 2522]
MKKVAIITTGGTIASKHNEEGRLNSGAMTGEELNEVLDLPKDIDLHIISMIQKPSMHLTFEDLDKIRVKINELFETNSVDGVVVTHGTDSLEETAYYLDLTIDNTNPIVVTGSQRSPEELGSDAFINLRHAIYSACDEQLLDVGTIVVFNERVFAAQYVKKEHASNIQGFNAFGFGYLGIIDNDKLHLYQKPIKKCKLIPVSESFPKVEIIKAYLGADEFFINACMEANVDGIIIEGVGRGQVSPKMMPKIQEAIKKGIRIVITTAAEEGAVYTTYDYLGSAYDLSESGVTLGKDYDSKKARIKLICLIRANEDINKVFDYY